MSVQDKSNLLHQKSKYFICIFQNWPDELFHKYHLSKAFLFGVVDDYVIKIEFQAHGSPNIHTLLWIKIALHLNVATDEEVCVFINKYNTAMAPQDTPENSFVIAEERNTQNALRLLLT